IGSHAIVAICPDGSCGTRRLTTSAKCRIYMRGMSLWGDLRPRPSFILDEHNIESVLQRVEASLAPTSSRALAPSELSWYREFELTTWSRMDQIIAASPIEREEIEQSASCPVTWLPIGLPLVPPSSRERNRATLLF